MQANCPRCGKSVHAMTVANQSRDQVKQDGKLKVMHLTDDSKEGDHHFSLSLPDGPDDCNTMLDHAFPE